MPHGRRSRILEQRHSQLFNGTDTDASTTSEGEEETAELLTPSAAAKAAVSKQLGTSLPLSTWYDVRFEVTWIYNLRAWVAPFPSVIFSIIWFLSLAWLGSVFFLPIGVIVYIGGWLVLRLTTELHEASNQRGWKTLSSMTW